MTQKEPGNYLWVQQSFGTPRRQYLSSLNDPPPAITIHSAILFGHGAKGAPDLEPPVSWCS